MAFVTLKIRAPDGTVLAQSPTATDTVRLNVTLAADGRYSVELRNDEPNLAPAGSYQVSGLATPKW